MAEHLLGCSLFLNMKMDEGEGLDVIRGAGFVFLSDLNVVPETLWDVWTDMDGLDGMKNDRSSIPVVNAHDINKMGLYMLCLVMTIHIDNSSHLWHVIVMGIDGMNYQCEWSMDACTP